MSGGVVALTVALAILPGENSSSPPGANPVAELQAKALALGSRGDVQQATQLLRAAESQCPAGARGDVCRQSLLYTLGYLYQADAGAGEPKEKSLRQAAAAYEKLLAATPAHEPSIENLLTIYRERGDLVRAAELLARAMKADPTSGGFALQLGDLYFLDQKNIGQARQLYERAAGAYPYDGAAAQRIVLTYRQEGEGESVELLNRGQEWERSFPTAAREAYETVMRSTFRTVPATAEQALTRWTGLLAQRGSISVRDLEGLPGGWDSPRIDQLRAYLAKPERGIEVAPSWTASEAGRAALQWVGLTLGRELAEKGDWPTAEAIWRGAAAVPSEAMSSSAQVELLIELASLYATHSPLDPDGKKLLGIEIETIRTTPEGPSPRVLQRYHTTLGLLYVERGQWAPEGLARGVDFHLAEAVKIADSVRWEKERFYQPLARLRERLTEGHNKTGAVEALPSALAACRAYLDTDDLKGAARTLETALRLASGAAAPAVEVKRLGRILDLRIALDQRTAAPDDLATFLQSSSPETAAPAPQRGFDRRQRFKLLSDFPGDEPAAASLENARRALGLALEKDFTLVGAGDLLRLKKVQKVVLQALGTAADDPEVVPAGLGAAEDRLLHPLSLPTDTGPAWVRVSPDVVTAAKVLNVLGSNIVFQARLELRIRAGTVLLDRAAPDFDLSDLARKIEQAGVKVTVVGPS